MNESHTEVLVIGAGPTGLFFAGELARHGVIPRVIDRCLTPHTQTRATGVQPGILEVLHRSGLADQFLADAVPVKGLRILDENLEEVFVSRPEETDSPFKHTCSIAQWRTEEILSERLPGLGVHIERGVTAKRITQEAAGVRVECSDASGRQFVIHADYLVGAGGAHGPSRSALEQHLEGITYDRPYLVADVASRGVFRGDNLLSVAISKAGMLMIAELPGDRTLVVVDLPETEHFPDKPEIEDLRQAISRHLRRPFEIADLRWISTYRAHRRMSPKFTDGRIFLAGDAAHLCSPLGGEGMNSGFLDGASLAWKLGAVLRRHGKPELLAAYEPERHEIARQVLASSEAMHDFFYTLVQRAIAGETLETPPRDPTRKSPSPDMLELGLTESPLLGYHGFFRNDSAIKPGRRFPERARLSGCLHHLLIFPNPDQKAIKRDSSAFARRWEHVFEIVNGDDFGTPGIAGVNPGGAVLVRPDGLIGFQAEEWNDESRAALEKLLHSQFHPKNGAASEATASFEI